MKEKVSLLNLFVTFSKIGLMTFGGGLSMLPILVREISEKRNWVSDEDLSNYFAIGQCTPGIIAVNTATFTGKKLRGNIGGIVAPLGLDFPSVIIILTLARVLLEFSDNIHFQHAFIGIRICVIVLVLNTIINLAQKAYKGWITMGIFALVIILSAVFQLSPIISIIATISLAIMAWLFHIHLKDMD